MIKFKISDGKDELDIPCLSLGTASFEYPQDEQKYISFLDGYIRLGGSLIDTARVYGGGLSEEIVGRWQKLRNNRNDIVIATKGGHPDPETMLISRMTKEALESDLDESLRALKTDYIDIYLLHRDDKQIPVSEIMPILNEFVKSGKVRFLGASNWTGERIEEANDFARENNLAEFKISQINYSLAHTDSEMFGDSTLVCMNLKEFTWYNNNHFPLMAYSPQAKGFFSRIAKGESVKSMMEGQFVSTANLAKLAKVKELCEREGYTPAVVPLGYLNSQPFPITSVFSISKMWQLDEDMQAQDLVFDNQTIAFLENMY